MHAVYSTYVCKITTAQKKCDLHVLFLAQTVIVCSTPSPNAASAFATKMISSSHLPPLWPPWPISTLLTHLHCKNPPSQNKCKQTTCTYTLANVRNSKLTLQPMLFTSPSKLSCCFLEFVWLFFQYWSMVCSKFCKNLPHCVTHFLGSCLRLQLPIRPTNVHPGKLRWCQGAKQGCKMLQVTPTWHPSGVCLPLVCVCLSLPQINWWNTSTPHRTWSDLLTFCIDVKTCKPAQFSKHKQS